tara:strand:+ start:320 stop:463 length:144 start_codon:yes stop_codon:yes gene_type:complete
MLHSLRQLKDKEEKCALLLEKDKWVFIGISLEYVLFISSGEVANNES